MKKVTFGLIMIFATVLAFGQSNTEDIELVQAMFGKNKKELVKEYMTLPADKAASFWTIYDQYETDRKAYSKKRISLIEEYANAYASLDDKQANALMGKKLALYNEYSNLQKIYFEKITAVIGAKQSAKLFQLEDYIENAIRISIQQQIPFIGQLEKEKK